MNCQQLAAKKELEAVEIRMSGLLQKTEFDKLKKRAENFVEKDWVDQLSNEIRNLDRGMGDYATN